MNTIIEEIESMTDKSVPDIWEMSNEVDYLVGYTHGLRAAIKVIFEYLSREGINTKENHKGEDVIW